MQRLRWAVWRTAGEWTQRSPRAYRVGMAPVSSTSRPHSTPGKDPVPILQEAGWVPRPVWTDGKSRFHRDSIPDRTVRSQSLYRLSYRAHSIIYIYVYIYIHILVFKPSPCSKCNLFLFWVIPRRLSSNCRRFGTHCRFHLHRQVNEIFTCIWRWNRKWVPKRRLLELRRRGITQKGTQYILYIFVWAPVTHVTITTAFSAKLSPSTLHACYWTLSQ